MRWELAGSAWLFATTLASAQQTNTSEPAGTPAFAAAIERHIRDLADPARADDAATALQNIGAACVPFLRRVIAPRTRGVQPDERVLGVLYVLGTMQPPPVAALDDVCDMIELDGDERQRQALWCAGRLGVVADAEARTRVTASLQRSRGDVADRFLVAVVCAKLQLAGQTCGPATIAALDESRGSQTMAICEWLLAQPSSGIAQHDDIAASLRRRLEQLLAPAPQPCLAPDDRRIASCIAEAWLHTSGKSLDLETARALLGHWNQFQRLRGLAWLDEHGAPAPLCARRDLAAQLWDRDDRVQRAASNAFAHWGAHGLIALPSLRALANSHADAAVRERCATTADEILAAATAAMPEGMELLAALDAMLRGEAAPATAPPKSRHDEAIWHEILTTLAWSDAATGQRVLDFATRCGVNDDESLQMVLGYVSFDHVGQAAFAWLARCGRLPPSPDAARTALEYLQFVNGYYAAPAVRAAGVEALAWLVAGPPATDEELTTALEGDNLRVLSRAAAELVRRGTSGPDQLRLLRRLLFAQSHKSLVIEAGIHDIALDIGGEARLLAALALAQAAALPDWTPVGDLVRAACGCTLAELPKWLADARRSGRLAAFLDDREAAQRARMELQSDLAWPHCAR